MRLTQAIEKFVMIKRGAGCKYALEARILKSFCTQVGDIELRDLTEKNCVSFTSCPDDTSLTQSRKYYILKSMFDWCVARKYLAKSPLFYIPPKEVKNFVPFIYSKEQIKRILHCASLTSGASSPILGETLETLFLLIYACGLRLDEALSLQITDVDFDGSLILIRETKFRKSRNLPICEELVAKLKGYFGKRKKYLPLPNGNTSHFFATRTGNKLYGPHIDHLYEKIRGECGVLDKTRAHQPRIHDLRHTFAVHRLYDFYANGGDVNENLKGLSAYLGHKDLEDTKEYLTMTPDFLQTVAKKFEKHAFGGGDEN